MLSLSTWTLNEIKNSHCSRSDGISMHLWSLTQTGWEVRPLVGCSAMIRCISIAQLCWFILLYPKWSVLQISDFGQLQHVRRPKRMQNAPCFMASWLKMKECKPCRQKRSWSKKESKLCRMPCCDSVEYGGAFYTPSQLQLSSFILINREGKLHTGVTGNK